MPQRLAWHFHSPWLFIGFRDAEDLFKCGQVRHGRHFQKPVGVSRHAKNKKCREVTHMQFISITGADQSIFVVLFCFPVLTQ